MSKAGKIIEDKEMLFDRFVYDESSPSFLRYKIDITTLSGNRTLAYKGDAVGTVMRLKTKEYWQTSYKGHPIRVHRIIAAMYLPDFSTTLLVNHIDGNGLNNSISNLEMVTNLGNSQRMKCHNGKDVIASNRSGINGISFIELLNGSKTVYNKYVEATFINQCKSDKKKFRYETEEEKQEALASAIAWRKEKIKSSILNGESFYR